MIRNLWGASLSLAFVATAPIAADAQQFVAESLSGRTKIEIRDLKREDGGMVMLRFKLTNVSGDKFYVSMSVDDSHLIDGVNRKKYLVIRDSARNCLCASFSGEMAAGSSVNLWAKFPAPPESVHKMSIVVPQFEPIDVPIASR